MRMRMRMKQFEISKGSPTVVWRIDDAVAKCKTKALNNARQILVQVTIGKSLNCSLHKSALDAKPFRIPGMES